MSLYSETIEILEKYNTSAKKRLGQNFLINEDTINKIVNNSNISKEDLIIEIGPGIGSLTKELIKNAFKTIAIEIDNVMVDILKNRFLNEIENENKLEIINEDILKIDLKDLIKKNKKSNKKIKNVKIVANLPYYITTPIVMKLLEDKLDIETITIMIQKEVATRLLEKPGGKLSGAITYAIYYYTKPETIKNVSPSEFFPSPKVSSEVIKLNVLKNPSVNVIDEKLLFKLIKVSFMRKKENIN